jgi:hypothetical protein
MLAVIIATTTDFKFAVQSLHELSTTEHAQDLELPDMIPFKG